LNLHKNSYKTFDKIVLTRREIKLKNIECILLDYSEDSPVEKGTKKRIYIKFKKYIGIRKL